MPRSLFAIQILLLSSVAAIAQTPAAPSDEFAKLPPGAGRDVMVRVCSKCHTPEIVADQTLDEAGWRELVEQMAGNGANASDAEFDQIVAYLAKAFPAK